MQIPVFVDFASKCHTNPLPCAWDKGIEKHDTIFVIRGLPVIVKGVGARLTITFRIWAPKASEVKLQCVSLLGNRADRMERFEEEYWRIRVKPVRSGRFRYKFLLDGDWVHDTDVPGVVMNCFGTFNSVAIVD